MSAFAELRKLKTSMSKIARPSPQPAAARVQDVRPKRRVADRVREVGDVGHRQLGLRGDVVSHEPRIADDGAGLGSRRILIDRAVLARVGPRDGRPDVVHADAELDRAGDPGETDVAADAVAERVPGLRVLGQGPRVGPHRSATPEDRISGEEARVAVGPRVAHAHVVVQRAARVESTRAVAGDAPRVADGRCETSLDETVNQNVVAGVAVGGEDRESTRLNSSHLVISYAVFCLKKKKNSKTECVSTSVI